MIFPTQVKRIAEDHLRLVLGHYSSRMSFLFEPVKFDKWCRLCAERVNQMDMAGYVKSREAMVQFIESAARAYADVQLRRIGENPMAVIPGQRVEVSDGGDNIA